MKDGIIQLYWTEQLIVHALSVFIILHSVLACWSRYTLNSCWSKQDDAKSAHVVCFCSSSNLLKLFKILTPKALSSSLSRAVGFRQGKRNQSTFSLLMWRHIVVKRFCPLHIFQCRQIVSSENPTTTTTKYYVTMVNVWLGKGWEELLTISFTALRSLEMFLSKFSASILSPSRLCCATYLALWLLLP